MKNRKSAIAVVLVLLALASVVVYFAIRREPAVVATANAPPPTLVVAPPPAADQPVTAPAAATNAAPPVETAETTSVQHPATGVVPAASRADKGARNLGDRDRSVAKTAAETEKPEKEEVAPEPVASAAPPAPEPAPEAPPPPPAPKPVAPEPGGSASGRFQDRVGPTYSLERVTCLLDGQTVYSGPGGKSLQLFQRTLTPGSHTVSIVAQYRGNSAGVFSYVNGYRFKVSSGRRFSVVSGKPIQVSVTGFEKGGPTDDFSERLALAINAR